MPEISTTNFGYIEMKSRLDAEYYRPIFLEAEKVIADASPKLLRELLLDIKSSAFYGSISPYYNEEKKGFPFVRVSDIEEPFLNTTNILFLPISVTRREKSLHTVTNEYLLVSKGGTTGNICFIPHQFGEVCISRDVIGIKIDEKKINRYFLLIFLLTKYGKAQLLRGISRQTLPHLTLNVLRNILVPTTDKEIQKNIERIVNKANEKRTLAGQKYKDAEKLVFETLGISEDIEKLEEKISYEANFERIKRTFNLNAEYYHPKYLEIINILTKPRFEVKPLKKVVEISDVTLDPIEASNRTRRFKYVPIAKISETGEINGWTEFYGWQAPSRARMVIRKGDILIPSLAGTFNKIALVPENLDGNLTTTGCFVVKPREDIPEFLFLLLRTPLFRKQLEQQTTGAIMSAVPKSAFGDLLIPVIPREEQQAVAELVKEFFELRKEVRDLIQRAVKDVEEVIENATD